MNIEYCTVNYDVRRSSENQKCNMNYLIWLKVNCFCSSPFEVRYNEQESVFFSEYNEEISMLRIREFQNIPFKRVCINHRSAPVRKKDTRNSSVILIVIAENSKVVQKSEIYIQDFVLSFDTLFVKVKQARNQGRNV